MNVMNKTQHCFNRSALTYENHCHPQRKVGSQLVYSLQKYLQSCHCIADLGCGNGIITEELIRTFQFDYLYAFDFSPQQIHSASERINKDKVHFYQDDINNLSRYNKQFDLIFSNMVLHWNENIFNTLKVLRENLAADGIFAFTLPLADTFCELKEASKNHFSTLEEISNHCTEAGLSLLECYEKIYQFNFPTWIAALRSIKATGANHVFQNKHKGLLSSAKFTPKHFFKNTMDDEWSLTYKIGYFLGRNLCPSNSF